MPVTNYAQLERAALCDLLLELGPDADTLCAGWTTRDLAAHLIVREHRPDAAVGLIVSPLAAYGEKVRLATASRPYGDLVDQIRSGPPPFSPTRIGAVDRAANTMEFFIHHEDVRRAQAGWQPRALEDSFAEELARIAGRFAKLTVRRSPVGIELVPDVGDRKVVRQAEPMVELHGPAGEIVLFVAGRQAHARLEVLGPPDASQRLQDAEFGI